jgi:hypothetical protein
MTDDISTITKDAFLQYLKDRRNLDAKFGPTIVETYKQKEEKYAERKNKLKTKMETDAEYKERVIAKRKEYYAKYKEKMQSSAEPDPKDPPKKLGRPPKQPNPEGSESEPELNPKGANPFGREAKSDQVQDDVFTPPTTPQPIHRKNYISRINLF